MLYCVMLQHYVILVIHLGVKVASFEGLYVLIQSLLKGCIMYINTDVSMNKYSYCKVPWDRSIS